MKNFQKGFVPIVVIILLVVLAGGGYVAYRNYQQPTTDNQPQEKKPTLDMANWKTYRNEKYGFEFRYPVWYEVYEDKFRTQEKDGYEFIQVNPNTEVETAMYFDVAINILIKKLEISMTNLEELARKEEPGITRSYRKITIGGQEAIRSDDNWEAGGGGGELPAISETRIYFIKNSFLYELIVQRETENLPRGGDMEKILSTFKFTPLQVPLK